MISHWPKAFHDLMNEGEIINKPGYHFQIIILFMLPN